MKRLILLLLITFSIVACSNQSDMLEKQIDTYTEHWNNNDFLDMYDLLSNGSKAEFSKEEFVSRYEKIYKDIEVENLNVSYELPEKSEIKKAKNEIDIPIKVSLDTIAGPISFTENLTFIFEEKTKDETANWKADFHPGLIFPELKDGGKLSISHLPAERGEILDRNKKPLAVNGTAYEIGVTPESFVNEESEKQQLAKSLNLSVDQINNTLNQSWVEDHLFVPLKKVQEDDSQILNQIDGIPAVTKKKIKIRTYPLGSAAAHLVGYLGKINAEEMKENPGYQNGDSIGKRGLEQLYENELKGTLGTIISVKNEDDSEVVLAEKPGNNGKTITLAIDKNIQEEIFNSYDGKAGTASAIDPQTGEVLALVSSPAFEPNDFVLGVEKGDWETLENNPKMPLLNRFSSTFAPGSVIKPITAAIGLKNETIIAIEGLKIDGLTWGKESWGGSKVKRVSTSSGPVDLKDALVRSDNIYFAMQATKMGEEKFVKGLKEFGFNSDIPTSYPIKKSSISRDGELSSEALLAHSSYGQGQIEMSALHLASSYSPILNKGDMLKPRILESDKKEVWGDSLIDEKDIDILQDSLRTVVTDGTAKVAKKADFPIAGKTGTAELKSSLEESGSENGWFVGYPNDQKNIIIAMMVEEVENEGASTMVAEKVTDILIELRNKKIHSN